VGLRTIELRQKQDQWGRSFVFVVNGIPILCKGSNWAPADSFPTRITDEYLEGLIRSAAETHQNMLRVWGGGFYEEERFYDLCDRYGILVWQEFIFSCSIYPLDDPEFTENVRLEVVENIRRLRHRASLALWCGNNLHCARPRTRTIPIGPAHHPPILHSLIRMANARETHITGMFGTEGNHLPRIETSTHAS
jgi:beta-mannosidase